MATTPEFTESLTAPFVLEYQYKRSLGPVLSRFFTDLRDGKIVGIKAKDGRVVVPPTEYDPRTGEALSEFVDVKPAGAVLSWTWVDAPQPKQPLQKPCAWALVKLDGADTGMLHVVDAGSPDKMKTGMRVRVRWAQERVGFITDIACFEPEV